MAKSQRQRHTRYSLFTRNEEKSRNGVATITKTKHMLCDFRIFYKIKHKEKVYTQELVV